MGQERSHGPLGNKQTALPMREHGSIYRLCVVSVPAIEKDYGHAWNAVKNVPLFCVFLKLVHFVFVTILITNNKFPLSVKWTSTRTTKK